MVAHPAPGHTTGTLVNALLHHCRGLATIGGASTGIPSIARRWTRYRAAWAPYTVVTKAEATQEPGLRAAVLAQYDKRIESLDDPQEFLDRNIPVGQVGPEENIDPRPSYRFLPRMVGIEGALFFRDQSAPF